MGKSREEKKAERIRKLQQGLTIEALEGELKRVRYKQQFRSVFMSTIYMLVTVAAVAVLVATLWLPVMQIYGTSMSPTLADGNVVFSVRTNNLKHGDIIAFYYNNKILVKRVIATAGEWVDIDENGVVYINDNEVFEPYIDEKALGDCNIELPYQIPESRVFVMGDHRSVSIDSRNTAVGCVAEEQIVGKIVFRVWPFKEFGGIH